MVRSLPFRLSRNRLTARGDSSIGQSAGLIIRWFRVQAPVAPLPGRDPSHGS